MKPVTSQRLLIVNSGSSSIKFAIYSVGDSEELVLAGKLDGSTLRASTADGLVLTDERLTLDDRDAAIYKLTEMLRAGGYLTGLAGIGYRIVHGGPDYSEPVLLNDQVVDHLRGLANYAPDHIPDQVEAIESISKILPDIPAVACFDTAFHRTMPRSAQLYGLTLKLAEEGVIRYGFHGISYAYIVSQLRAEGVLPGRLIVAHLGNGASMAAIRNGESIDTSMGFTPTGGFPMSNRSGDLDPGVILHLLRECKMSADEIAQLVNKSGGLKGLSGISSDMQELEKQRGSNAAVAEAIEVFCYQIKKFLGAYCFALGGLDALVFTGGIGENSNLVRRLVCEGLEAYGIVLEPARNESAEGVISADHSAVSVRVMKTNEELMIARYVARLLAGRLLVG